MIPRLFAVACAWLCLCTATCAQDIHLTPPGVDSLLGADEAALRAAVPALTRAARPVRGPGNSRGKWILPGTYFAEQPFDVTFYFNAGQVSRIEYQSTAQEAQCRQMLPFGSVLDALSRAHGSSGVAGKWEDGSRSMQSVAFSSATTDISLFLSVSPEACSTQIVLKARNVKDASEL